MYDVSWGDGWNDLSMSIGLTRYSPDRVWTQDRTTYSQFLNVPAKPLVSHEDTIIASFDIPCKLWPVVASLQFAGICFILHWKVTAHPILFFFLLSLSCVDLLVYKVL